MDHQRIEEENVAESYVAGQLGPEDEAWFEEHLLECRECRERVAWAEDLRDSFRALGAEEAGKAVQAARVGVLAWLARQGRGLGIAAVLLLVALLGWLLVEQGKLRRELAVARAAPALPSPPSPPPPPVAPAAPGAAAVAERDRLAAEGQRLTRELAAARERGEELARRLAALTRPQVNTAIFSLGLVRGGEEPGRVLVGAAPEWVVLVAELPSPPAETYQAALADSRGRTLWRGAGLRPAANDTLVLSFYSDLLPPGGYRLVLTAPGQPATAIPFTVARLSGSPGLR